MERGERGMLGCLNTVMWLELREGFIKEVRIRKRNQRPAKEAETRKGSVKGVNTRKREQRK
jgi:hypothetical protein